MEFRRVNMSDLSVAPYTRRRGAEAYAHLAPTLGQSARKTVLRIDAPYSTSFLDGFILGLAKDGNLEAVTFDVADDRTLAQLERVSGVRKLNIYYTAGGVPRRISRRAPRRFTFRRTEMKPTSREKVNPFG